MTDKLYTREELVEVILAITSNRFWEYNGTLLDATNKNLSALEEIGEVKIKGGSDVAGY